MSLTTECTWRRAVLWSSKRSLICGALLALCLLCSAAPALADSAHAAFTITSDAVPTIFSSEYNDRTESLTTFVPIAAGNSYVLTVTNVGGAATNSVPITISDTLPEGLRATHIAGAEVQQDLGAVEEEAGTLPCDLETVTCTYPGPLVAGDTLRVRVQVEVVTSGTAGSLPEGSASVSGGGATSVSTVQGATVGSVAESLAVPFGLSRFTDSVTGVDGSLDTQAGDHPYETTVAFAMNSAYSKPAPGAIVGAQPYVAGGEDGYGASLKDAVVDLPPGFVGNPQVVAKCPEYKVGEASAYTCPPASQIGVATVYTRAAGLSGEGGPTTGAAAGLGETETVPIFNMAPDRGYPAQFSFQVAGRTVVLYANVSQETNYAVRVIVKDIPSAANVVGVSTTFFGTPETDSHLDNQLFGTLTSKPTAFLDNPASCSTGSLTARIRVDTWQRPGRWTEPGEQGSPVEKEPTWAEVEDQTYPLVTGCDMLQFDPALEVSPDTMQADEPSGLTVHLHVPQAPQEAPLLVTPAAKEVKVTLPAGLSISPSAADGLEGCSDSQIDLASAGVGSCPAASQIGTVQIVTPLLSEPLEGQVFLASPSCDPCSAADAADGTMLKMYLQASGSGVVIKKEGTIYANPATGQLTTVVTNIPQLPFGDLYLKLKSGLRAPLATPQTCGSYTTTSDFTPWSTPVTPAANPFSPFDVSWDGNGGACPATPPLKPSFSAGTSNPNAGQFSPLTVTFGREDREQDLSGIQVRTPPGLLGILTAVPLCGEPQAAAGTCPEASKIGSMTVAAGPGSHPFYEKGALYLTQSYKSAPFGLSIVVPTVAGPFNLGNVVVRATINIDPKTAALTVTSDPLPQVIDGIPLRLRTANVTVDRPGFIFNPSNCAQQSIAATITGAQGTIANVSAPLAVAGCTGLKFAPKFTATTSGKTSKAKGASLDVKLSYPTGPTGSQANIRAVKVDLPKQLPSRLTTLQKACTAQVFEANPANCPPASIIGIVKATTPLLPVTLTGPAYFVSHGGEAFPDLEIVLQGYGVRVDLTGNTFISHAGITSSTFKTIPDVPVNTFELYLPQGKYSALAANGNLCTAKLAMPTAFTGQNGAEIHQSTKIAVTGCAKPKPKKKQAKTKKTKKSGNGKGAK